MSNTRVEIPEISNRRLGYLARIVRPVVSLTTLPQGKWPQEHVETFFLKLPKDLRGHNFLKEHAIGKPKRFVKVVAIETFHTAGSAGREFHPTIAEVLAQIPNRFIDPKDPQWRHGIVAFETFLENYDPESVWNGVNTYHKATTVLLTQGSPVAGTMRTHYS